MRNELHVIPYQVLLTSKARQLTLALVGGRGWHVGEKARGGYVQYLDLADFKM